MHRTQPNYLSRCLFYTFQQRDICLLPGSFNCNISSLILGGQIGTLSACVLALITLSDSHMQCMSDQARGIYFYTTRKSHMYAMYFRPRGYISSFYTTRKSHLQCMSDQGGYNTFSFYTTRKCKSAH